MKAQRITLNDIAALAGVTKMTVSRYLRTPDKVKPETAERIASVIAEIGYEPDPDNPAMIGVVVPRIGVLIPPFITKSLPTCWPVLNRLPPRTAIRRWW